MARWDLLWLVCAAVGSAHAAVPKWAPTYDMNRSTILMPCNVSGFLDPSIASQWGLVDFDWSNGKGDWTKAKPMDCEERLVTQASMVKTLSPNSRVWVYRNLVKALPWYSSVREKILDPAYAGFFLKFKAGGYFPSNGTYHVPKCTASRVTPNATKCSDFYHDQEQTPINGGSTNEDNGWKIYNPFNGVSGMRPDNVSIWRPPGKPADFPDWQSCEAAATAMMKSVPQIRLFTWWASAGGGTCWLSHELHEGHYGPEADHVMGYKGPASDAPMVAEDPNECNGDCDCGDGLPCGEYLWDHRNGSMLREFLVNEFVLNPTTGLANPNVDGFYFDDGWTDKPSPVPAWAPKTYRQCDMWNTGGATEEDYYCVADMGLTQADVTQLTTEHAATMQAVLDAVVDHGGFAWPLLTSRRASLDLADPRPVAKCTQYLQRVCQPGFMENVTYVFEFTRKTFHDPFPLPLVVEDIAQFLLVRGRYGYIGHSWMGCIGLDGYVGGNNTTKGYEHPPELDVDYGAPVDPTCTESAPGVFVREWTKASVKMDCNDYTATIKPKP